MSDDKRAMGAFELNNSQIEGAGDRQVERFTALQDR